MTKIAPVVRTQLIQIAVTVIVCARCGQQAVLRDEGWQHRNTEGTECAGAQV